jgi:hypothetical protein
MTSGNEGLQGKLNDFASLGDAMKKYEARVGNPSGTARGVIGTAQAYNAYDDIKKGHPVQAAISLIAPYGAAKFLTSSKGMRLLTTASRLPASSPLAAELAAKALAAYKLSDNKAD